METPTYMAYFFFNVTNKEEFLNQNPRKKVVKPHVEEIGPYVYRSGYDYRLYVYKHAVENIGTVALWIVEQRIAIW